MVAGTRSERALSNSWTDSQFSAETGNAFTNMSVRRRPGIFPVSSVTRGSDSENHDPAVESRLNNSKDGDLASRRAFGTSHQQQRTQNQTFENTQEPLKTSPGSGRLIHWLIFGLKNTCKRFFRPRIAADSQRIEFTCVSIN